MSEPGQQQRLGSSHAFSNGLPIKETNEGHGDGTSMNNNQYDIGPNKKGNLVQLLFGSLCSTACPCEQGSKAKPSSFKGFPWKFPRRVVVEPSAGAISKQSHLNSEPSSTNHFDLLIGNSQLQTGVQVPAPPPKKKEEVLEGLRGGHQMEGI